MRLCGFFRIFWTHSFSHAIFFCGAKRVRFMAQMIKMFNNIINRAIVDSFRLIMINIQLLVVFSFCWGNRLVTGDVCT